jgi:hypothetical protein
MVQTKQSLIGMCLVLSGVPFYYYFKRNIERRRAEQMGIPLNEK